MKKTEEKTFVSQVTVDVLCNKCGKSCRHSAAPSNIDDAEYMECFGRWGYWSDNLDGERHTFELCSKCYQEFAKTFMIPPTITEYDKYQ